jgi:hypothetical protein
LPDFSGYLKKMNATLPDSLGPEFVRYQLSIDDQLISLNEQLGKVIRLSFTGSIHCIHCGRRSNKSFNQGYCYTCFISLAQCDICVMSPEKCHYNEGTCREPDWGMSHCMVDHIVYLANSSGTKVGITRVTQLPTRWIDQGAIEALPIFRVKTRQQSGFVEDILRKHISDRTNWRTMLKGLIPSVDLVAARDVLYDLCRQDLLELENRFGLGALQRIESIEPLTIGYPVLEYPLKVVSYNVDKNPQIEGTLMGIKGQYLILDNGVINIRKYTAYHVDISL